MRFTLYLSPQQSKYWFTRIAIASFPNEIRWTSSINMYIHTYYVYNVMIMVLRNTHQLIEKFLYKLILLNNTLCLTLHLRNVLWSYSSHPPLIPPVSCKNFYNEDNIDCGVRTSFGPKKGNTMSASERFIYNFLAKWFISG